MKKTILALLSGVLLASCSKNGGDSAQPPPPPAAIVVAVVPSYAAACINAGYGSPETSGGYRPGYYPNDPQYFPGSPFYGDEIIDACPMNSPVGALNSQNFASVPISDRGGQYWNDLRRGYWNNGGIGIYFRLSLGVSFNGGSYWSMGGSLPGGYYGSAYYCTKQQTMDFYQNVALPCGYQGGPYQDGFSVGETYDGFRGYNTNQSALYTTSCKNRFIEFKTRNPDIFCSYSYGGIFGILDERYLIHNICTLNRCGL